MVIIEENDVDDDSSGGEMEVSFEAALRVFRSFETEVEMLEEGSSDSSFFDEEGEPVSSFSFSFSSSSSSSVASKATTSVDAIKVAAPSKSCFVVIVPIANRPSSDAGMNSATA